MDEPTVTTTATGRASGDPDEVALQFAATATESSVADARRAVAERAARLREVLDDVGVPAEQVRTTGFRVNRPPANRGPGANDGDADERPYEGTESVRVTLHDHGRIDPVLSGAVEDAGLEIRDVTFTFRTATRRELQREAVADAVETARAKAAAAAAAEGSSVGDARAIVTEAASRPARDVAGQQLAMETSAGGGSVESGPLDVTVSVEVEYALVEE